jgi:choloylglycine hydrolase
LCTALTFNPHDHYFGRNLDLEISYGQQVVIAPRNYRFKFRRQSDIPQHYALIGVATVVGNYPLYFDATNEHGLSMAGLNYPGNAFYPELAKGKDNVSPFEFIPWILCQCATVRSARDLLSKINLVNINFSDQLPLSPLHWLLADKKETIVIESDRSGLHIYDDPVGVLTNNPSFDMQLFNLNNYRSLARFTQNDTFGQKMPLTDYSRGLGTRNLPGGLDSESRFVRAAFNKANAVCENSETAAVTQLFHILHSVEQQNGLDEVAPGKFEFTIYSAGYNQDKGLLYYTTYQNNQINVVDMNKCDLDDNRLTSYPFIDKQAINAVN